MVDLDQRIEGPVVLTGKPQFCDEGERLAVEYMNEAQVLAQKERCLVAALEKLVSHGKRMRDVRGCGPVAA